MTDPYVETDCTFAHNGRTYESGGAVITDDRVVAYLASDAERDPARVAVTTWHGETIGRAQRVATWRVGPYRTPMHSYHVTITGRDGAPARHYTARGQGPAMVITGRRIAGER